MTGLGADMFILYYNAKSGEVKFINGTAWAPQAATIEFYKSKAAFRTRGRSRARSRAPSAARRTP